MHTRRGFTLIELLVVIAIIGILAAILCPPLPVHGKPPAGPLCNNLKQVGLMLKMYANESKGEKFPNAKYADSNTTDEASGLLQRNRRDRFHAAGQRGLPEYLTDVNILICPSDEDGKSAMAKGRWNEQGDPELPISPCRIDDVSYVYVPWALTDEIIVTDGVNPNDAGITMDTVVTGGYLNINLYNGLVALITNLAINEASGTVEQAAALVDADLAVGPKTAYRLREGIERFGNHYQLPPAPPGQSELPVFYDNFSAEADNFNHVPGGCNVLYMDGHVEFLRYPAEEYPGHRLWACFVAAVSNM